MKTHEAVYACDAFAVYSAIACPTSHFNLNKAGLTQKTLNEALKRGWIYNFSQDMVEFSSPRLSFIWFFRFIDRLWGSWACFGLFFLLIVLSNCLDDTLWV